MGIEFKDAADNTPKKVIEVVPVKMYFVRYNDGAARPSARIALRVEGAEDSYLFSEKISGDLVVKQSTPWFHKDFVRFLRQEGLEGNKDGVDAL